MAATLPLAFPLDKSVPTETRTAMTSETAVPPAEDNPTAAVLVIGNRRARDMVKNWLAAKRVVMQSEPDNGVVGKVAVPD